MSAGLAINPASEDDLPVILRFIEDLAIYERLRSSCVATIDKLRQTLFTSPPAAEVVIARLDGQPVGFALFYHNYSTFLAQRGLFLEDLFVNPDARNSGVGRALLSHLAQIAIDRNCGRFEWNVLDWNEPAITFYKRIGAMPMDDWTTFRVSGDALKQLASAT